jgi:hypothetical protein
MYVIKMPKCLNVIIDPPFDPSMPHLHDVPGPVADADHDDGERELAAWRGGVEAWCEGVV